MAATFEFSESNTVSEVVTDGITNLNFGSSDAVNLNTAAFPIAKGSASFEKYIRAKFSGVFSEISNMLFYKSLGALVAGETIKAAANEAFVTPAQAANGDSDIPTTIGLALVIQSYEGLTIIEDISGVSGYTKYIRLQLQTTGASPSGAVNQKTFTFCYDEV